MADNNKTIITGVHQHSATPEKLTRGFSRVDFNKDDFENLIKTKGLDIFHEKTLKCPCITEPTGNSLVSCINCGGTGYLFIERKTIRAILQGMNKPKGFKEYSETDVGVARMTTKFTDRVNFMDRIIVKDSETYFYEILFPKEENDFVTYLQYEPTFITDCLLFRSPNESFVALKEDIDFTVNKIASSRKITFAHSLLKYGHNLRVSIRYCHMATYHVIDVMNDIRNTKDKTGRPDERSLAMPVFSLVRRAHFVLENNPVLL